MADHGHGKPKGKPKAGGHGGAPHGGGGHGESSSPSGWMLLALGIVAVVLLIMFYSGSLAPPIPVSY